MVQIATLSNPAASDEDILAGYQDFNRHVRAAALINPRITPPEASKRLFGFNALPMLAKESDAKSLFLLCDRFKNNPGALRKFLAEVEDLDILKEISSLALESKIPNAHLLRLCKSDKSEVNSFTDDLRSMFLKHKKHMLEAMEHISVSRIDTIKKLHDFFDLETRKMSQPLFDLPIHSHIARLDGKELAEGLKIALPKTSHDLVELGRALNLCVGNGDYAGRQKNGESTILATIDSDGKFKHCLEISKRDSIMQFKSYSNANETANIREFGKVLSDLLEASKEAEEQEKDDMILLKRDQKSTEAQISATSRVCPACNETLIQNPARKQCHKCDPEGRFGK